MLLAAEKITKSYNEKILLNDVSLYLNEGDKIGIIGINGTGKSTLLKILAQVEEPDAGTVTKISGVQIEYLAQNPQWEDGLTVLEQVFHGASASVKSAKEYEAKTILTKLGITDFDEQVSVLSGGQRKRVAIASALVRPCDVLILDEPTNHLDNEMVEWLEGYLAKYKGAMVMVTHDRYFLDRVTNEIVEIDNGNLYSYEGNYSKFVELKAQREESEIATTRKRKSFLNKELEWIQRGARARGTKSKDRIARFNELSEMAQTADKAKLEMNSLSSRLGKKTVELNNISKAYGDKVLISDFEYIFPRDARIGIVGKNGCGKSTLLNIIAGKIVPDGGTVEVGETVKMGYFSQNNEDMDLSLRVIDYIKNISEIVVTPDGTITASQMLERFLFPPDLQWNTIGKLSGGERRRLYLLSVLMSAPNILLLDEPTNDLDIQTLVILEEYLENFNGAVIAVSHDRYFLDKVVDTIFEFQGEGRIKQFIGGYSDYLASYDNTSPVRSTKKAPTESEGSSSASWKNNKKLKFSYREEQEYKTIDSDIEALEQEISDLAILMKNSATDYVKLQELMEQKDVLEKKLDDKIERWTYLNEKAEKIAEENESV